MCTLRQCPAAIRLKLGGCGRVKAIVPFHITILIWNYFLYVGRMKILRSAVLSPSAVSFHISFLHLNSMLHSYKAACGLLAIFSTVEMMYLELRNSIIIHWKVLCGWHLYNCYCWIWHCQTNDCVCQSKHNSLSLVAKNAVCDKSTLVVHYCFLSLHGT